MPASSELRGGATGEPCPPLYAALVGVHDELEQLRDPDTVISPEDRERILKIVGN